MHTAAALAEEAGSLILRIRARGFAVNHKADRTLVTDADGAAEMLILDGLRRLDPGVPVVAEEEAAAGIAPDGGAEFWLVDPLDGTRDFAAGLDDFAVNVGLVRQGKPVLGAVGVPAKGQVFFGRVGHGAFRRDSDGTAAIAAREPPAEGLTLVVSRFHGDALPVLPRALAGRPVAQMIRMGSAAKFCWVAEGRADCYPRRGRTMEWDSAAPQAVVEAAGGRVLSQAEETPLRYGKPGWENPGIFCVGR
ncbi:3'(2'),5'-bisphosphate nucleotidase CysQ family protein [Acidisoma sp. 7E03]